MRRSIVGLCACLLGVLLAGCAAQGEKYQEIRPSEKSGKAQIVIFRPDAFAGGASCYPVKVDGVEIGKLANAGYLRYWVEPGMHTVMIDFRKGIPLDWQMTAGETNYFEFTINVASIGLAPGFVPKTIGTTVGFNLQLFAVTKEFALANIGASRESNNACLSL